MTDVDVFWHDDVLRTTPAAGSSTRDPRLARGARDAPRERRARAQHVRRPATRPARRATCAGATAGTRPRGARARCTTADYVDEVRASSAPSGRGVHAGRRLVAPGSWPALAGRGGHGPRRLRRRARRRARAAAYALVRPPGHHARSRHGRRLLLLQQHRPGGRARAPRGIERVAILDWDVHHGNGTQSCFYERDDVLTVSLPHARTAAGARASARRAPRPRSGAAPATGFNVNVELPLGTGDGGYLRRLRRDRRADRRRASRPSS